jgi:hypothetical protein
MAMSRVTFWFVVVLSVTLLIAGCSTRYVVPTAASPTPSAPAATTFTPTVHVPDTGPGDSAVALFGIASEMTESGEVPVEGVEVYVMSCGDQSAGCGTNIQQSTKTNANGMYRVEGLYPGRNNFVWIAKGGYDPVGMPASLDVCDDCNIILTLAGDTEFDFSLARK